MLFSSFLFANNFALSLFRLTVFSSIQYDFILQLMNSFFDIFYSSSWDCIMVQYFVFQLSLYLYPAQFHFGNTLQGFDTHRLKTLRAGQVF